MDYSRRIKPCINSEIGKLNYVMLHAPGCEIENMIPENAHKYLFSDILNLHEAKEDYKNFEGTLKRVSNVLYFKDLLIDVLKQDSVRAELLEKICKERISLTS